MSNLNFDFQFGTKIYFGYKKSTKLKLILDNYGFKYPCIVIDEALKKNEFLIELINELKNEKILIFNNFGEPTYEYLEKKRKELENKKIDVFIGIGGGSTLDLSKGLSVLYTNIKPAINYMGFDRFENNIKPIIAIPTTAGSGSEITPNASFVDTISKKKMGINGEKIRPLVAILDPLLTISCPLEPTIFSALDAIVHSTEAFVAKNTNIVAKLFAKKSLNTIFENLNLVYEDLGDINARENLLLGSFLAATALMNSGTGPAAAISYPLGVHFKVPHGLGGGISLPHVIERNIQKGYTGYNEIFNNDNEKSFDKLISELWNKIEVPVDLKRFKINSKDLNLIIKESFDMKGAIDQNPVKYDISDIKSICEKLI